MKLHYTPFAVLLILASILAACRKTETPETGPEETRIEIAGEGGDSVVELGSEGWRIVRIVNNDGSQRIFGDVRTLDGDIVGRNQPLELDGPGTLVSSGQKRGFSITRGNTGTLHVLLQENGSGKPFSFVIVLENGGRTREITVEQPESAGYSFEGIEYFLQDGDRDSIYVRKAVVTYRFDHLAAKEVEIFPFAGPDVTVNSRFESDDESAFGLMADGPVEVPVPAGIIGGEIYLSDQPAIYGEISDEPYRSDLTVTISTPAGQSSFATDIENRHRIVSYRLTVKSNSTGEPKEILGKWIETAPTGVYRVNEIR